MRILYVNHYAGSLRHGMEYRPYYLAREWVRAGHVVRVLAASYSHVRAVQPLVDGAPIGRPYGETIDGIDYTWYPTPVYSGNGLGRVRNIVAFLRQVYLRAPQLAREFRPDVVIASSTYPMDIWPARRIARLARARLVFEVHDLWPLSPVEIGGMSPSHPFIRICQKAEDAAYRHADVVVSMLPNVAGHMGNHGLDLGKLRIVPNGISLDEWADSAPTLEPTLAEHLQECRAAGRTIVGYAGSHGTPNALEILLLAASELRAEPFAFVLVGNGMEKANLAKTIEVEGLHNVRMFPPIAKAQIPAFLRRVDIAYIGWQRVSIYRFGIAPNKLMDYMAAGCVVLHSVEAGNDPVAEARCGMTVAPVDPDAVAAGLRRLAALTPQQRQEMGQRGREFVMANHTYPVLARRFLEAMQA